MSWHPEGVATDVPEVLEAREAYKQAEIDALALRARARIRLGLAVVEANERGHSLEHIARELNVATEQVRRYRQAYRDWRKENPSEPLDLPLPAHASAALRPGGPQPGHSARHHPAVFLGALVAWR